MGAVLQFPLERANPRFPEWTRVRAWGLWGGSRAPVLLEIEVGAPYGVTLGLSVEPTADAFRQLFTACGVDPDGPTYPLIRDTPMDFRCRPGGKPEFRASRGRARGSR